MTRFRAWRLLHVEIGRGLPELRPEPSLGGYRVIFWHDDLPLGHHDVPAERLPVRPAELHAVALREVAPAVGRHLLGNGFAPPSHVPWRRQPRIEPADLDRLVELDRPLAALSRVLADSHPDAATGPGRTSVVVCTRDRADSLARCLASLAALDPAPLEIVVVDNAPRSDDTRRVVERHPGVRYVREVRPGLSVARNTGLRESKGEFIAFTDDDVVVRADWILRLHRGFSDPSVLAVTGLVLPAELGSGAQLAFERSGEGWGYRARDYGPEFFALMRDKGVPVWRIGAGANMAFRRGAFDELGGFDERLGAGASGCSEDSEMWYRVLAAGGRCRYEPTAVVFHHHRMDWAQLRSQMYQYMRGHVVALLIQFQRYRHWGNLYRLAVALPAYYAQKAGGRLLRGHGGGLPLVPQVLGCLGGVGWWLRHPRRGAQAGPRAAGSSG